MTDKSTGKSYTTATGAKQWTKDLDLKGESAKALRDAEVRISKDFEKLDTKAFKEKYGVTYRDAIARIRAADSARASKNIKEDAIRRGLDDKTSSSRTEMFDKSEKRDVATTAKERKKGGYAKGGMVKANCGASMAPNRKAKK
jgi:hypothetical protein